MPDRRKHRGPHPQDAQLFGDSQLEGLRQATRDLSWLLSHGYAPDSSLKLVGDRYHLQQRQRLAVMRCSCPDASRDRRQQQRQSAGALQGAHLTLDGFNLLTTVEAALAGGVLLRGRDECLRDMASMHGSYRRVEETRPALQEIGDCVARLAVAACTWLLDRPVSNSGRLRQVLLETADENQWTWQAELVDDPDPMLKEESRIIVTADAAILDGGPRWFNLAPYVVERAVPAPWIVDLSS